jgi:tetratricopeptide (TPR) repeat protein
MANPLSIFFSRLALEDRRFIKRVCVFLIVLFILSGVVLYFYAYFESENMEQIDDELDISTDSILAAFDSLPTLDVPEHIDAEQLADEGLKDDPLANDFDGQAHFQLMRQKAKEYNYQMAYRHGARVLSYLLEKSELAAEWGHILLEAGKPQDAVSVLQKLNSNNTIKNDGIVDLAFAMHRSGETDNAILFLDDKLKSNGDASLLATKAAIIGEHPDTNRRVTAESIFKSALKRDASLPNLNYWYSRYLMQKGDYQSSKNHVEQALKTKPNEPRYIARLGMAEFYLKNDSKAEELYKKALKINPYDYNVWFNLGELYLSEANESSSIPDVRQKNHSALESYLKAIENDSLHIKAHYRIGIILNGNGGYKEAIGHLMMALEKMPNDIPIMQQLSVAHLQIGDTASSIDYLDKILQIDPFNKIAANEIRRIK